MWALPEKGSHILNISSAIIECKKPKPRGDALQRRVPADDQINARGSSRCNLRCQNCPDDYVQEHMRLCAMLVLSLFKALRRSANLGFGGESNTPTANAVIAPFPQSASTFFFLDSTEDRRLFSSTKAWTARRGRDCEVDSEARGQGWAGRFFSGGFWA